MRTKKNFQTELQRLREKHIHSLQSQKKSSMHVDIRDSMLNTDGGIRWRWIFFNLGKFVAKIMYLLMVEKVIDEKD